MSSSLTDPLAAGEMRYCSTCDNNSATYAGRFLCVPTNPEVRIEWLVRMGILKRTDPVPKTKRFFICDDHFDKEHDFFQTSSGTRLRTGILPWRKLKTGSYSYHGCDDLVQPTPPVCQCACCSKRDKQSSATDVVVRRSLATQTDDVECSRGESTRIFLPDSHCRLCLRGVRATKGNLWRLFCEDTRQPADPELMEQIFVATGLMLNWNQEADALVCPDCAQQAEEAYRFRLQSRSNNRAYLMSIPAKKRKELYPEHVLPNNRLIREGTLEKELPDPKEIEQIQLNPTEKVLIKIEPDLPPQLIGELGGVRKKMKLDPVAKDPIVKKEFKSEPGLTDAEQTATDNNLIRKAKRIQFVNFQEFKSMMAKVNARQES